MPSFSDLINVDSWFSKETANQGADVKEEIFKSYGFTGSRDKLAITAETRLREAPYADPLTLNFKWLIDWDKPYGLFANESYVNSALAYLKRIGEETRYNLLAKFILKFKEFVRDYDFLILGVDGIAEIVNKKPWEVFKEEEDRVTFTVRESVDMRIQALLTLYRQIWYDDVRGVEVLPANLRRFDCYVLIYNAGYYSMLLYDITGNESYDSANIDESKLSFPTIKKLAALEDTYKTKIPFNHIMVNLQDASINNEESGKTFFGELSNEMSDEMVKNTIALSFRFANYSGIFHQVTGKYNVADILALLSVQNSATQSNGTFKEKMKDFFKGWGDELKNAGTEAWNGLVERGKNDLKKTVKSVIGKATPIGNALDLLASPERLVGMVDSAVTAGIDFLENKYVYGNLAKLNNLVSQNFSDTILTDAVNKALNKHLNTPDVPDNKQIPNDTQKVSTHMEPLPEQVKRDFKAQEIYTPEGIGKVDKGVKYQENIGGISNNNSRNFSKENIYKRTTF